MWCETHRVIARRVSRACELRESVNTRVWDWRSALARVFHFHLDEITRAFVSPHVRC
jgi:hypothetical protein